MALPTAGMTFDRPTGYVMPLIRAGMIEAERDGRPRGEAPEIAVLTDCYRQFDYEGLQRLVMDVACTAAKATTMLAEMSPLNQVEILQEFSAQHTVEMAFDKTFKSGDVVWGYIPAMLRPIFQPETRPHPAEVLFEIDEKYGFSTSMDFIIALAYYTGAIIHRMAKSTGRSAEDTALLLESRAKAAWAELDTYDKRPYMNR
ncbi:hypothetical protein [Streptomyces sp. Mg1]|uniref:hypothetical protein n=1 Tax=Streptomyces sp. Mg1 TaxID=465541 RepID=UPI00017F1149|nr:hypothetical protein [Streptomyces sp. Mg1]